MPDSLKGTYSGDCRKGKASGQGVATGADHYEGSFKDGWPEGMGLYTWRKGDQYKGQFRKGLRSGQGEMIYKTASGDSLVRGFWKNDLYTGEFEHPWHIWFRSRKIIEVEVEHKDDRLNQVTVFVTNTSTIINDPTADENPRLSVTDIEMIKGTHGRVQLNNNHAKKSETIISDITHPCRMKLTMGTEEIDIEFREAGSYVIHIRVHS